MYQEKKIKIQSFQLRKNPNITGSYCAFSDKHFIDYRQDCYIHPNLKIIICIKCRNESYKGSDLLKYHNKRQTYNDHNYDSTLEANHAKTLDLLKRIKKIKDWEKQKKIEFNIKLNGPEPILTTETGIVLKSKGIKFYHLFNYYVDFVIYHLDGSTEFQETKGAELKLWQAKWICTQACFTDKIKLTVIKQQSYNPKRKRKAS
jgi:hypothetical protein